MKKRASLRQLLSRDRPLVTPGAHDALSAAMIEAAGFEAAMIGGLAMLASQYGLPDIGIAGLNDMVEGARRIMGATNLPCAIDGDDGYGDVKNVVRTVAQYETLGVGSIIFEDQDVRRKRPGEGQGSPVIGEQDMVHKLRAALDTRNDPDTVIFARTDAYKAEGFDAALRRADAYLKAGADGIFIAGLSAPEDLRRAGEHLRGCFQLCVVTERMLPTAPSVAELHGMGFSQIVFPHFIISRTVPAMDDALSQLKAIASGAQSMAGVTPQPASNGRLEDVLGVRTWLDVETRFG